MMNKKNGVALLPVILIAAVISACSDPSASNDDANKNNNNVEVSNKNNDHNTQSESSNNNDKMNNADNSNNKNDDEKADDNSNDKEESKNTPETVPVREYSEEEQDEVSQEFLDWAIKRAEEGEMAVTDNYFGHGASGSGDWYAVTEDGEMQVQEQDTTTGSPGYDAFDIHALGGVVFYTSLSGVTGLDEKSYENQGGAGGGRKYTEVAEADEPLHKYLLGDNGVVYELTGNAEELDNYQTGFGLYDDDGKDKLLEEEYTFKVSDDKDAQKKWEKILKNINDDGENNEKSDALSEYSDDEIEYARIWLQLGDTQDIEELNVHKKPAGTPLNPDDDSSVDYPEDVVQLAAESRAQGSITYSSNGDGTITVYNKVPTRWDGENPAGEGVYEKILKDKEQLSVDTGNDKEVEKLIKKLNIHS